MGLWDDLKDGAKKGIDFLGETAEDLYDKGKLTVNIEKCRFDLRKAQQKLGELTYNYHRGEVQNDALVNECLEEIDALLAQLVALRGDEKVEAYCPKCGAACKTYNKFCARCGAKLKGDEEE